MKKIITLLLMGVFMGACVKNNIPYVPPVDENFDWKTTASVALSIPPTYSSGVKGATHPYASTVKVYTSPLYSESSLIASGASFNGKPFETSVDLPKQLEQVFVKLISPEGLVTLTTYDIVGNKAVKSAAKGLTKSGTLATPDVPKPSFPASYDVMLKKNDDLKNTFTDNKTYYIPQGISLSTTNTNLLANWIRTANPKLYVAGNLVLGGKNSGGVVISYSSIVVLNGGSVTIRGGVNLAATQPGILAIYVQKGGKLSLEQGISAGLGVKIVNEGEAIVKGACDFTNSVLLYNTGKLVLEGELMLSNGCVCHNTNTGEMDANKISIRNNSSFYNYGGNQKNAKLSAESLEMTNNEGYFYQHGLVEIDGDFKAKGKVDNYGRIECETLTDGTIFNYYGHAGSLLKTEELFGLKNSNFYLAPESILFIYQNGNGKGNTDNWNVHFENKNTNGRDYALILWGVSDAKPDNTIINENDKISFTGNIENYCPKKNETQNKKYTEDYCTNNAFWGGRKHHIPASDYNEGLGNNGGDEPVDKDGDGVPEGEDVDDNDPTVTHVSYFPSASTWGSYFFEDLWPFIGDYDMNDIVLDFRLAYYTKGSPTAGNPVVYMDMDWKLRAVGSQLQLAFGVQLDGITPAQVAALESNQDKLGAGPINRQGANGLESNQSKAVFALFNNPDELFGVSTGVNVFRDSEKFPSVEKRTRVRFTAGGVAKAELSVARINPFVVVSSKTAPDRGHEIHLSTHPATDKINTAYYQQGFVSNNNPFKATSGMVWGYMVPVSFRYPAEMVSITKAYPNFAKWYQSSGQEYENWYDTSIPGNVVEEYLYEPATAQSVPQN